MCNSKQNAVMFPRLVTVHSSYLSMICSVIRL
uniref:Uncharacterized protein n=1 Tax=Arundo donax TaxID=35708 RepID=A0A0A9AQS4_ARUDO